MNIHQSFGYGQLVLHHIRDNVEADEALPRNLQIPKMPFFQNMYEKITMFSAIPYNTGRT